MRAGLFIVVFASLLAVLALGAPLRFGPRSPDDTLPPLQAAAECLHLSYPVGDGKYLPTAIRLESEYAPAVAPRGSWYVARTNAWKHAGWRPWGRDSIDVASYYDGPRIRLPILGNQLEGRSVSTGVSSLLDGMFWGSIRVHAVRVRCESAKQAT